MFMMFDLSVCLASKNSFCMTLGQCACPQHHLYMKTFYCIEGLPIHDDFFLFPMLLGDEDINWTL